MTQSKIDDLIRQHRISKKCLDLRDVYLGGLHFKDVDLSYATFAFSNLDCISCDKCIGNNKDIKTIQTGTLI